MKRFSEQLHKKSQTVKLKAAERSDLRERLVSYMEYHPLPAEMKETKTAGKMIEELQTESFKVVAIPFKTLFKYSSAMAAIILIVLPVIAERAVPGDTLYAIKVQFNEELRGTLTFDAYEKVEWETERVNRRIAEAKLLASEGKLTEEVEAEVAQAVREHTANAQKEIAALRVEDVDAATIASIALDTTLEVQSNSLKANDAEETAVSDEDGDVSSQPKANLIADAIDQSRVSVEDVKSTSTLPAYDKMMARVEFNTTRIYELFEALKQNVDDQELADVSRRIDDINRAIADAIALKETDESAAKQGLVAVLQSTQKLIVLMTDLHVVKEGGLDTLLPVVLTEEEKDSAATELNAEISEKVERIESLLANVSDTDLLGKIEVTKLEIDSMVADLATTSMEHEEFVAASEELLKTIDDVLLALEENLNPEPLTEDTSSSTEPIIEEEVSSTTEDMVLEEMASSTEPTSTTSVDIVG